MINLSNKIRYGIRTQTGVAITRYDHHKYRQIRGYIYRRVVNSIFTRISRQGRECIYFKIKDAIK